MAKVTTYFFQCVKCGIVKKYRSRGAYHCNMPMQLINAIVTDEKDAPQQSCYITTATCLALNKGDKCEELQAFRAFRDNYMKKDNGLEVEVEEYYNVAPIIVEAINKHNSKESIYLEIYNDYLAPAYEKIKAGLNSDAYTIYKTMVKDLCENYLPKHAY